MHRVLISEGSSLSARQIITALGMAGYRIGVCDPNPRCLGRYSRYVTQYYRSPAAGREPERYFDFVAGVLRRDHWEVLLPAHEQAFLFARERSKLPPTAALASAEFLSFIQVQGKSALTRTLARLELPQPAAHIVKTQQELMAESSFPFYLKADYGTAATHVWCIHNAEELQTEVAELVTSGLVDGVREFVVQEAVAGPLERVQAVFDRGRLVACHVYRQVLAGPGGGDIAKIQVDGAAVRQYVERLGEALNWSGALSLDYILREEDERPVFIDANPRLVEPMNAVFSGVNLAEILVRVSLGEEPKGPDEHPQRRANTHAADGVARRGGAEEEPVRRARRADTRFDRPGRLQRQPRGAFAAGNRSQMPVSARQCAGAAVAKTGCGRLDSREHDRRVFHEPVSSGEARARVIFFSIASRIR